MTQNFHRVLALDNADSAKRWRQHAAEWFALNFRMAVIALQNAHDCEWLAAVEDRLASKAEAEANGEVGQAWPNGRYSEGGV